jgi:hypothetical protein
MALLLSLVEVITETSVEKKRYTDVDDGNSLNRYVKSLSTATLQQVVASISIVQYDL